MLSNIAPSISGVFFCTLTALAKVPSTPSTKRAKASQRKASTIFPFTVAIKAKNPKTTPSAVNKWTR